MVVSGVSSMCNVIMQYFNSFLSCSIRNLTSASLSRLFTKKKKVFAPAEFGISERSKKLICH